VALIPVGAILYVSAVQLGSSSLKDLALALFVGMAAGAYSSIFIATPLLVHLKSNETEIVLAERRAKARERAHADRYASVPSSTTTCRSRTPTARSRRGPGRGAGRVRRRLDEPTEAPPAAAPEPEAMGRGRTAPAQQRPVGTEPGVRPAAADPAAPLEAQVTCGERPRRPVD
jgi:preprotein translocase subunit SecF